MSGKRTGLEHILYGDLSGSSTGGSAHSGAPASATMLVSLFLILITFFVVLNNHAKPDAAKRKAVFESMQEKFGKPADALQAFGGVVQPKVDEFTLKIKRVLGQDAIVESTIEGEQTKITFAKDLFFYRDEAEMRAEKVALAQKTAAVLKEIQNGKNFKLSIIGGMEEYRIDKKKILELKNSLGIDNAEVGLSTSLGNQIMLVVENGQ